MYVGTISNLRGESCWREINEGRLPKSAIIALGGVVVQYMYSFSKVVSVRINIHVYEQFSSFTSYRMLYYNIANPHIPITLTAVICKIQVSLVLYFVLFSGISSAPIAKRFFVSLSWALIEKPNLRYTLIFMYPPDLTHDGGHVNHMMHIPI